jgi:hypothetical protein
MFGILAYPAQGIYKSAKAMHRSSVEQTMASGRMEMLAEDHNGHNNVQPKQVIGAFRDLSQK